MKGLFYWGVWNKLPFDHDTHVTSSWLQKEDEKLPDKELFWLTLRRFLLMYILRQHRLYRKRIPPNTRNILWLHITDHIGDSLMRLSSTILLKDYNVDLLATSKAADLFEEGGVFRRIYRLGEQDDLAGQNKYDLVMIDALHTKPLKTKYRFFRRTPFVSQNDFFHYCRDDYNLTIFSFYRMAYLLNREEKGCEKIARLSMECKQIAPDCLKDLGLEKGFVGVVIGGREDYRIYKRWDVIIKGLLQRHPHLPIVLLGSENANDLVNTILAENSGARIVNSVGMMTLKQTGAIIACCRLVVCADGGLLHVANAVKTPSVCLFAQEYPDLRYSPSDRFRALRSDMDVNSIDPDHVIQEVDLALRSQWMDWEIVAKSRVQDRV